MKLHQPNLLIICTDQQWAEGLSCAGNRELQTPHLDALAARGTRFARAYCAQPVCVPSRTAMQTGMLPHRNGVTYNCFGEQAERATARIRARETPMLGRELAAAGYDTAYFGKWHVPIAEDTHELHGWRHTRFEGARHPRDSDLPQCFDHYLAVRDRSRPFAAMVSFTDPHNICEWASGRPLPDGDLPDPPAPEDCPPLPANFEPVAHEPEAIRDFQRRRADKYGAPHFAPPRWRQYRWAYWRLIERVDALVGRVLRFLDHHGLRDETLVLFTSDHGDGAAAHRWCQKQALFDECVRVPLIAAGPGVRTGAVREELVNVGIDLLPTCCAAAGATLPDTADGTDLAPLLTGSDAPWRDHLVVETDFHGTNERFDRRGRLLVTARWHYAAYEGCEQPELLTDRRKDPGETRNLAGDVEQAAILADLRSRLAAWCVGTGDDCSIAATTATRSAQQPRI